MKARFISILTLALGLCTNVHGTVYEMTVTNTETWVNTVLAGRQVGDTIHFSVPVIVNRNYGYSGFSGLTMSVRRIFSPTNQEIPLSPEYQNLLTLNSRAGFNLQGCGYHRNGERLHDLKAVVTGSLKVKYISGKWEGNNTREAIETNVPSVDMNGTHNVLVCGANLEYYLAQNLGTGYGPDNQTEHNRQKTKVCTALARIHADVYGLVEIEQGQVALAEIADYLTSATGSHYSYVDDKGSPDGSYTKSAYIYNSDRIQPVGELSSNNQGVKKRKYAQGFILLENNERFIYSINHFKAKSGSGTGLDADQGDGQGIYNHARVLEARSVLQSLSSYQNYYKDNDVLIMGDLNAYAKEDPIRVFTDAGLYDLHRYFHEDSSYSYVYGEQAGYLDHAIANPSLIEQVTGMTVWHVNSDESDEYTYDKSYDQTVFRYSDHDPVLVGLRLDSTKSSSAVVENLIEQCQIGLIDGQTYLMNVGEMGEENGYYEIYGIRGEQVQGVTVIEDSPCLIGEGLPGGVYMVRIYYAGRTRTMKMLK